MLKQKGFTAFELFFFLVVIAGVVGWIANIVKLIGLVGGDITTMFVLRVVGIFAAPFGAILGFF